MNKDFSKSAVNLVNPDNVKELLTDLKTLNELKANIEAKMQSSIPAELKDDLESVNASIASTSESIKAAVEESGSYQDVDRGWYAVKQKKVSVSYDALRFEAAYPDAARLVIVMAVNEKALAGLIKGGLITEADLKAKGITQEKESYSYIIQVA